MGMFGLVASFAEDYFISKGLFDSSIFIWFSAVKWCSDKFLMAFEWSIYLMARLGVYYDDNGLTLNSEHSIDNFKDINGKMLRIKQYRVLFNNMWYFWSKIPFIYINLPIFVNFRWLELTCISSESLLVTQSAL